MLTVLVGITPTRLITARPQVAARVTDHRRRVLRVADLLDERAGAHRADPHLLAQRLGGYRPVMPEAVLGVDPPRPGQQFLQSRRISPARLTGTGPTGIAIG